MIPLLLWLVLAPPVCDMTLWGRVYHHERLVVQSACLTVTGTVADASHGKHRDGCRREADGDLHCFVKLDPGQEALINQKNRDNEDSALVYEPMCQHKVTQEDAKEVCKNWKQKLLLPPVGTHVKITGAWVLDTQHGHEEIHPVSSIEIISPTLARKN